MEPTVFDVLLAAVLIVVITIVGRNVLQRLPVFRMRPFFGGAISGTVATYIAYHGLLAPSFYTVSIADDIPLFWRVTAKEVYQWSDSTNVTFVTRRIGHCSPEYHPWKSIDAFCRHVTNVLQSDQWRILESRGNEFYIPESEFVPKNGKTLLRFVKDGDWHLRSSVLVWPDERSNGAFSVVVVTVYNQPRGFEKVPPGF